MAPFLKAYKYEAVYVDETCTFMGQQTSELDATMPIKFTTPSYTVVGIFIGKVRDADTASSDGEGALPTSPPIHHSFFEDIIKFLFFRKDRTHTFTCSKKLHLNKLFVKD